jgi:hypothetical protein
VFERKHGSSYFYSVRITLLLLLSLFSSHTFSQETPFLKVHFLYGSKPKREYKSSERKWFGGVLGGHAGIESQPDEIINFMRGNDFHWFAHRKNKQSRYAVHSEKRFYSMFRGTPDSVKRAIIYIPVTEEQMKKFDSLAAIYLMNTPYDYAFIGMRCGSATYDLLAKIGVLKQFGYRKTYWKIFYPRRVRKRILRMATANNWRVEMTEGTVRRKWERDVK